MDDYTNLANQMKQNVERKISKLDEKRSEFCKSATRELISIINSQLTQNFTPVYFSNNDIYTLGDFERCPQFKKFKEETSKKNIEINIHNHKKEYTVLRNVRIRIDYLTHDAMHVELFKCNR